MHIGFAKHIGVFLTSARLWLEKAIRYRLIQRSDWPRFVIIIDEVIFRTVIAAIRTSVPPIPNHIIHKTEITVHPYRRVTTDIGSP